MKTIFACLSALTLFFFASTTLAAGSGGFSGGGSVEASGSSPKQQAKEMHNAGMKFKRRALGAEEDLVEAEDEEERAEAIADADENWKKALAAFSQAYELNNQQHQSLNEMGFVLRKLGDYENAVRAYNSALRLKADFPEAIEYRAEAFLALGSYDQVKESYLQLIDVDADQAATLMQALQKFAIEKANDSTEAVQSFVAWINERSKLAAFVGGNPVDWRS